MSFLVDGQSFGSMQITTLPDKTSQPPVVKDDTIEHFDYCPYCELLFGIRVRPSGNPYNEGRVVTVGNQKRYPVCHLHTSRQTIGNVKSLPIQASA